MTTPIKYRISSTATKPVSDSVKGAPLTSLEIDGNFRSIKDSIELIQSAYLPAGYSAPVEYVAGVILSSDQQTVAYQGEVYAPKAAELPFTTSGTFEVTKFVQIQGVAGVNLAAPTGSSLVGYDGQTVQDVLDAVTGPNGASMVGFMPAGTGAVATTVLSKLLEFVNVKDFGAVGDGVTDDTVAIKKAVAFAASLYYSADTTVNGGYTYNGIQGKLLFPKALYVINEQININLPYVDIDFDGSIITPGASFPAGGFAFNLSAMWIGRVRNGKLWKFPKAFSLANANLDSGHIIFDDIQFSGLDVAFDITTRSSFVMVRGCRFDKVKQVAIIRDGDKVVFSDAWVNPGVLDSNYSGVFELKTGSSHPGLELVNVFWVPRTQTASNCVCVKIEAPARITIDKSIFGGEAGGLPLIANYADASINSSRGTQITVSNSMVYSSSTGNRAAVELYALPNSIVFDNVYGYTEETHTAGLITYKTDFRSFATADSARLGNCQIHFVGRQMQNFFGLSVSQRSQLNKFIRSRSRFLNGYASGCTNTAYYTIAELDNSALRRGQVWKIRLNCPGNSGADRYSEYVLSADYAGTTLSKAAIIEGASTVAPRLSISGSNFRINTNGAVSSTDYTYDLEKICDPSEGYA